MKLSLKQSFKGEWNLQHISDQYGRVVLITFVFFFLALILIPKSQSLIHYLY